MTLTDLIIRIFLTSLILASLLFPAHSYKEELNIKKTMMSIEVYNNKAKTLSRTSLEEYRVKINPSSIEIQRVKEDNENEAEEVETIERRNIDIHNVDMHKIYKEYYKENKDKDYYDTIIDDEKKEITIIWNELPEEEID